MSDTPALKQIIEGAILAAGKPLSIDALIQLFALHAQPSRAEVREVLAVIQEDCEDRGFELKEVASGYRFQVRSEYGAWVGRLWEERPPKYTRAFLETLALIAYKQPITRGDIEDIRGVSVSTNIMRSLLEREWVRIVGHRDVPGRPAIYATTRTFLDYFDLTSLDGLPTLSEIKDLDKVNEELDLELIQPRTLDLLEADAQVESADADDTLLQEVTNKVNTIQENIKNLFQDSEEDDQEDELEEDEPGEDEGDDEPAEKSESQLSNLAVAPQKETEEKVAGTEAVIEGEVSNSEVNSESDATAVAGNPEIATDEKTSDEK